MKKYWYYTLPGVVAALGWATIFAYALLRALAGHWWMIIAVAVVALLAGAFNAAIAMPQKKKKVVARNPARRPSVPPMGRPGTH